MDDNGGGVRLTRLWVLLRPAVPDVVPLKAGLLSWQIADSVPSLWHGAKEPARAEQRLSKD